MKQLLTTLGGGAALLLLSPFSYADFITNSNLAISGINSVAVNQQYIDFGYSGGATVTNPPVATGTVIGAGTAPFMVTAGSTGSFASLVGSDVIVSDLCRAGTGVCASPVTPGVSTNFSNFVTFVSQPTWSVDLTLMQLGTGGSAGCVGAAGSGLAGQTCSIAGSPFDLENTGPVPGGAATGAIVSFAFQGTITNGVNTDPIRGDFSTTFSGTDLQTILADIAAGDSIATSDSATLTVEAAATPEPSSMLLAGFGGVLLAIGVIRRKARGVQ